MLITEFGGDPPQVDLSYSSTRRFREEKVHKIATDIKMNMKFNYPLGLHWDGKIMADNLDNITKIERLPVLVSSSDGTEKLLGVAKLPVGVETGTAGQHIAEAAVDYLKEWDLLPFVATMHFDTTNTNTGKHTGACIKLQDIIDCPLLWVACRKHIGEVHVGRAFDILKVEVSVSPEILIFNRFKIDFSKIDHWKSPYSLFDIDNIKPENQKFYTTQKDIVISTLKEVQRKGAYLRNDYEELINLVYLYLGENDKYTIHKPGATHKARWLMKILHSIKIVILQNNLPSSTLRKGQLELIHRFVLFIVFCYVPWWFTCPIGTAAARNDLAFYNILLEYEKIDEDISKAVQASFKLHQWYIIPETIPLALFDEGLDSREKENLAKRILSYPQKVSTTRDGNGYGKPRFPKKVPTNVVDAVYSSDVWMFFKILKIPTDFLNTPFTMWKNNQSYLKGLQIAKHLKVCNDLAERAIKLTQDYCHQTNREDKLQEIVQVVEKSRSEISNIRKSSSKK